MRVGTVARNYAETLLELGKRQGAVEAYGALLDAVAGAVACEPKLAAVLESPRVPKARKQALFAEALAGRAPGAFAKFLAAVVQRGRQGLLSDISREYEELVDAHLGRVHAGVTTARELEPCDAEAVAAALKRLVGQEVLPHYRTDPKLLGGIVVRMGDRVLDGSLRRRLLQLRFRMLHARTGGA